MGKIQLSISQDSRFTEEIINQADNDQKTESHKYDIAYKSHRACQVSERNPGVGGSKICMNCYYNDLSDKMEEVRKSKRVDFMKYQLSLRENKEQWLDEFKEILTDYEDQFDRASYSFAREYKKIIDGLRIELNGDEPEEKSNAFMNGFKELLVNQIASSAKFIPSDIAGAVERFRNDFPDGTKTAFLIMQFTESEVHESIIDNIKEVLESFNIKALRADDKEYSDDLFANIKTYMHCCDFGIAIFERVTEDDFNPNVSLEVGYMMGLNKPVCLLKDRTLKSLQTDLAGKLYKPINLFKIKETISKNLTKWIIDKEIVK